MERQGISRRAAFLVGPSVARIKGKNLSNMEDMEASSPQKEKGIEKGKEDADDMKS